MLTYTIIYFLLGLYLYRVAFLIDPKTAKINNIWEFIGWLIFLCIWPIFACIWSLNGTLTFKTFITPIVYFFKN